MSPTSSNAVEWFTLLEPIRKPEEVFRRPDDPRLGEIIEVWNGAASALKPGRAVLIGFPQDEGVGRNNGRIGAAQAPHEIRQQLFRLTPCDVQNDVDLAGRPPLDAGNVRITGSLEQSQQALGEVIAGILQADAVPIVLGGGHETAYGHYLGYVLAGQQVGIINIDAHLDVRPCIGELGHSGSAFRQAMMHPLKPLPGSHYVCLGAQPHGVSRAHWLYALAQGCVVRWRGEVNNVLDEHFRSELDRLAKAGCEVYLTIDADAVNAAEVPGVSAPNPLGLSGSEVIACARMAGCSAHVSSIDLVELNPHFDRDGQSARWAALVIWNFLMGLACRGRESSVCA